jgi:hypothetical protein
MDISFDNALDIVVKFGSIALLALYVLFSVVVIRQINLMVKTLTTEHDAALKTLAWVHLGVTVLLLLIAIIL